MLLRWGIVGAGKISHDFVSAIKNLPDEEHQVIAIAARNLKNAQEFASTHGIQYAYEGYEKLAKNPDIDIIYVGSINPQHYDVAMLMLNNNKHVLCEKPLCMNYKQSKKLIDFAKEKKLFLMEAVWSRFFPAYVELRNIIKKGDLGEILYVHATFGVKISHVPRLSLKAFGGGTVLDIGIYTLQFTQMIFKSEPSEILASGFLNEDGVDLSMSCVLTYPNGCVATLSTHSQIVLPNEAIVVGTKGTVKLPNFWCPEQLHLPDGTIKKFPLPTKGKYNFLNSQGLCYEAAECHKCIKEGLIESPLMSHNESLQLAQLEDNIRKQLGVHYKEDAEY